jgi:hypothetical protein
MRNGAHAGDRRLDQPAISSGPVYICAASDRAMILPLHTPDQSVDSEPDRSRYESKVCAVQFEQSPACHTPDQVTLGNRHSTSASVSQALPSVPTSL